MKLFAKYSRVNIVASILALLVGSVGYYFAVRYVLVHQLDDTLKVEEAEILDYVSAHNRLPEPANYRDQQVSFQSAPAEVPRHFFHTSLPEEHHKHLEPFRVLTFSIRAGGQLYTATIAHSEEETEDLLELIMLITGGIILLLLGTLFLANRLLLRRIWQPFYHTLDGIRQFNLSSRQPLPEHSSDIEEFRDLNAAVKQMTTKILKDYEMLKSFTDNASHEMQTPLAIINSKLDLLIQDTTLGAMHHQPVQAMYDAISRLRQLNQSLLLLMKIENNQYVHTGVVDLEALINEKLIQLEDPLKDRHLEVQTDMQRLLLPINSDLADILLNNLLTNAIRHNLDNGRVIIRLRERSLQIINTGAELGFDAAKLFDRFIKGTRSSGTGLGLAIVRQICDNYQFPLLYTYENNMHGITVHFPE